MSFSAPDPPNAMQTSQQQQQFNTQAGQTQNSINSYGQSNPYSSMNYVADPSSPSGYRIDTTLSAPQQGLLNTQTANQAQAGGQVGSYLSGAGDFANQARTLGANTAGMYSNAPNIQALDPTAITSQLNSWQQKYQQPLFDQQSSNLEAQLRSQGLTPGSEAYNNAKNLLARNQGDVTNQFMTNNIGTGLQAQQQKFGQDVTNYGLPLQTEAALLSNASNLNQNAGGLAGYAAPQGGTFQQAPNATIQPANYQGAAQNAYQGQLSNYQNTWNNVGKLGVAAAGIAGAPFTGGLSLGAAGGLAGMFGGSPGPMTYGSSSGPTAFYGNNTSGGWG